MNTKYIDLVEQTLKFPQEKFKIANNKLIWQCINLMELTTTYNASLKFTYLPEISDNVFKVEVWFQNGFKKHKYIVDYFYDYCTKTSRTITLPDSWVINQLFIMLLVNTSNKKNKPALLDYLNCNSLYYYNSEQRINEIYLPIYKKYNSLYIAFSNTSAHQESNHGLDCLKHSLMPHQKQLWIGRNENEGYTFTIF